MTLGLNLPLSNLLIHNLSRDKRHNKDVATPNSTEETLLSEGYYNQKDSKKLSLQTCLKKEGGCDISRCSEFQFKL